MSDPTEFERWKMEQLVNLWRAVEPEAPRDLETFGEWLASLPDSLQMKVNAAKTDDLQALRTALLRRYGLQA